MPVESSMLLTHTASALCECAGGAESASLEAAGVARDLDRGMAALTEVLVWGNCIVICTRLTGSSNTLSCAAKYSWGASPVERRQWGLDAAVLVDTEISAAAATGETSCARLC